MKRFDVHDIKVCDKSRVGMTQFEEYFGND
jgi:hypothetical protein